MVRPCVSEAWRCEVAMTTPDCRFRERRGHLVADVGRKQPPDVAVFAERMCDCALVTLLKAQPQRRRDLRRE